MKDNQQVTARVRVQGVTKPGGGGAGTTTLSMSPDYEDGRNREWAAATPTLSLVMTVIDDVAEHFELGEKLTLTFSAQEEESDGDDGSKSTDE